MASDLVQKLIDTGIHFGHKASRWNPKMKPFILGKKNTVHLINIRETLRGLLRARMFISQVVARNKDVLFVGTKRQARQGIKAHATRVGMHYVDERWLGGTLTNFRTIRSRLSRLEELEQLETSGALFQESKKTIARLTRERKKILRNLAGIRKMSKLPGAVVVIDARHEHNAIMEARKLRIPTICLIDTDSDPDLIDIPIPGNDDAIRAIELVVGQLADAVEEGKRGRSLASENKDGSAAGRRRSRRPTTSQLAAEQEESAEDPDREVRDTPAAENNAAVAVGQSPAASQHAGDLQS